ncbi:MAG TPA: hypothetical protein PKW83_13740 [Verrucomicrobiota bacterium]|nr:hypothetical protein [Verrucomicrobiota bacterium]
MANNHIELTGTETRLAGQMRSFVDRLQTLKDDSASLKVIADQAAAGGDWTGMRAVFGFASDADAEAAYNLLGSVNTTLGTDAFIAQMLSRLG